MRSPSWKERIVTGTARPHIRAPSQHGSACRATTLEARSQPLRRTGRPAAPPTRAEGSPGRPLRRGSVTGTGTCFLPSRSSSSWNPELTLEVATNQRTEPHAQTAPPQTCTPTSALGHLLARPCGWRGRAGGRAALSEVRPARYSQSEVYSTWEGCPAAPSAEGGVGAGLSAWALRTSMARG